MNRRRFCLQKGGSQEHISLITVMFCFNEFAFTVRVKHKINSIRILDFILICLYFTTGHFHTCVLFIECSLFPLKLLAQFSATVSSFMVISFSLCRQHRASNNSVIPVTSWHVCLFWSPRRRQLP